MAARPLLFFSGGRRLAHLVALFVIGAVIGGPPAGGGSLSSLFLGTMAGAAPEAGEFLAGRDPGGLPAGFPGSTGADFVDLIARDAETFAQQQIPFGHKFITGGAGEGDQQLGSEEEFQHREQVKSDNVLPSYCEPPNPCPVGFTAADGCLEDFDNTADFSRTYQAQQECLCDAEHMFNCPRTGGGPASDGEKTTTGEYEQGLEEMLAKNGLHKSMIAKKFHETRPLEPRRRKRSALAEPRAHIVHRHTGSGGNPYLRGQPLRSVAKKNGRNLQQM